MNKTILAEISAMTQKQIKIMNGYDFEREEHLRNARAALCLLKGQDLRIAAITFELEVMGAE